MYNSNETNIIPLVCCQLLSGGGVQGASTFGAFGSTLDGMSGGGTYTIGLNRKQQAVRIIDMSTQFGVNSGSSEEYSGPNGMQSVSGGDPLIGKPSVRSYYLSSLSKSSWGSLRNKWAEDATPQPTMMVQGGLSSMYFDDPIFNFCLGGAPEALSSGGAMLLGFNRRVGLGLTTSALRLQRHHIIPNQAFKLFKAELGAMDWKQNAMLNLKKLPSSFHANHPAYNRFVIQQIRVLRQSGNFNLISMQKLQFDMRLMIGNAYRSGGTLNQYFKSIF